MARLTFWMLAVSLLTITAMVPQVGAQSATRRPEPVTITGLFDATSPVVHFETLDGGVVSYVYFQAQRNLRLRHIVFYGEPRNQSGDYFFIQLFRTTADWDTPNGNGDRILHLQDSLPDAGLNQYEVPLPNVELQSGAFYRLSFQVVNMDWIQPTATNEDHSGPFLTSDGRFLVFGSSNPALGPTLIRTPVWFLGTSKWNASGRNP